MTRKYSCGQRRLQYVYIAYSSSPHSSITYNASIEPPAENGYGTRLLCDFPIRIAINGSLSDMVANQENLRKATFP